MTGLVHLDAASVDEVACRVVELLREQELPTSDRPLTVAEVAAMLGRSAGYVRDHRRELGVLPATGTRPQLRFDARQVRRAMSAEAPAEPQRTPHTRRRRHSRSAPELLPIRGRS